MSEQVNNVGNEKTKSLIRHLLTVLGSISGLTGLSQFVPALDFLTVSLDAVWAAVLLLGGFATTFYGFFKDKGQRFEVRTTANK